VIESAFLHCLPNFAFSNQTPHVHDFKFTVTPANWGPPGQPRVPVLHISKR
jgi:hypothetical protein